MEPHNKDDEKAAKGMERLLARMAQRRGFATVEAWQKSEKAEAHLTR